MKSVFAVAAVGILAVPLLPVVLLSGDGPTLEACSRAVDPRHLDVILTTIRTVESGGRYDARAAGSSASGAYQFVDTSWQHYAELAGVDTDTYPSAWMAPHADQDAAATAYVDEILADHDGRIEIIPVAWYLPTAIDDEDAMDAVPMPEAGNRLTPRQYQARWMAHYQRELQRAGLASGAAGPATAAPDISPAAVTAPTAAPTPGGCIGGSITPLPGDWSLPGPRAALADNPAAMTNPHHDYAAWDWIIPVDTPIYAVRSGHVDSVRTWPHNWWTQGCRAPGVNGCDTCGIGATIIDADGHRWTYCHGSNLTVRRGDTVNAGQQVMWSGNSGRSGTPHLHLEIRAAGTRRCPQPLLESLYHNGVGIDPVTLPTTGCSY